MESREVGFGGGGGSSCGIASSSAAASAGGTKTTLFHFNTTSSSTTSAAHTLFFGSSPEGMSNERGPAFTLVQREELERQTMIFKYMMASVPVPPQLLLPLTKNQRNSVSSCSSSSSAAAATDSEPWRCRRTDGKKWRCSRDVAPHQKYCERHSHKNRPRSRKPVELSSSINSSTTTRLQHISNSRNNSSSVTAVSSPVPCHQDSSHHHYLTLVNTQQHRDFSHASAPPSPRCLEWFTRGEVIAVPNSDQDWHHQHTKDLYHLKQHSHVPPDLCPYPDQARADALNDQCSLLLGLPSSLEGASNNNGTDDHDKAGPCSLLSLAVFSDHVGQDRGGQVCNEEDGSSGKRGGDLKPHWMSSGGPLAEALCIGSTGLDKSGPSDG